MWVNVAEIYNDYLDYEEWLTEKFWSMNKATLILSGVHPNKVDSWEPNLKAFNMPRNEFISLAIAKSEKVRRTQLIYKAIEKDIRNESLNYEIVDIHCNEEKKKEIRISPLNIIQWAIKKGLDIPVPLKKWHEKNFLWQKEEESQIYNDLLKQFNNRCLVPLIEITTAFFNITNEESANRKFKNGKLFSVIKLEGGKSPYMVELREFAKYLSKQKATAADD